MSDEEKIKEIIKDIKIYINDYINESTDENGYTQYKIGEEEQEFFSKIETVTDLTTKLQKEIEHQIEKRNNQKTELAILNEKQKDMNKLINEQLKENVSLQKELNEENKRCMILANNDKFKEQIIDLMAEYIATLDIEEDICANVENDNCDKMNFGECEDCIKKFFERKSEE